MLGAPRTVTLFGRFRLLPRADIARLLAANSARENKDLTRRTDMLAVGSGALNLVAGGSLGRRLDLAAARGIPVVGEARLLAFLRAEERETATLDPATAARLSDDLLALLNAFDLVEATDGKVRFQDADTLRSAAELAKEGLDPTAILQALKDRLRAPRGRHRLSVGPDGTPVLAWEDGVTTLSGQGLLPLDEGDDLETLFEAALEAEAAGLLDEAARLYETCAMGDKRDAIAPFNLGNVQLARGDAEAARLSYQRAIARQANFPDAHYNLARCLEASGDRNGAMAHLTSALDQDPDYGEAHFNLAQLELETGNATAARAHFERVVFLETPDLVATARKALVLIDQTGTSSA